MSLSLIPDVVDQRTVHTLGLRDTAMAAGRRMVEFNISAVLIVDGEGGLLGIVTERDLSRRVVAENRVAAETHLGDIMTPEPVTAAPGDSPAGALELMRSLRVRHIPIVDGDALVGIVSIRDLQHTVSRQVTVI